MTTHAEEYVALRIGSLPGGPRTKSTTLFDWADTAAVHNFADGSAMIHEMGAKDPAKRWVAFPTHVAARTALGLETMKAMVATNRGSRVALAAAKLAHKLVDLSVDTCGMSANDAAMHRLALGDTIL